jgi:hypothetical protein
MLPYADQILPKLPAPHKILGRPVLPDSLGSSPILRLGGHPSFIFGKTIRTCGVGRRDSKRKVRPAAIKGGGGE